MPPSTTRRSCGWATDGHRVLRDTILDTWRTSNRVTVFLVEHLPPELWATAIPGAPRRTVRMIAGHMHNARCCGSRLWARNWESRCPAASTDGGSGAGNWYRPCSGAVGASSGSSPSAVSRGGTVPRASTYIWRNLPLDVGHVLAYFVAHEAHHRGQIVLVARALGHRLPAAVTDGLWQWTKRAAEAKPSGADA